MTPTTQPVTLEYLTQQLIAELQSVADSHNALVLSNQKGDIWNVNVPYVTAVEQAANTLQPIPDQTPEKLFISVPFVALPPAPPPVPNLVIVVESPGLAAMGLYGASGDSPSIPVGTLHTEVSGQLAGQYKKILWGYSPMGEITLWQRIA